MNSRHAKIGALFVGIHRRLSASPVMAVLAVGLLLALVAGGLLQFRIGTQMTDALPEGEERDRMLSVMENFKLAAILLIHLEDTREEPNPDDLVELADYLDSGLEATEQYKHIFCRVEADEQQSIYETIFPRRFYLLPMEETLERSTPEGIRRGVSRTAIRLLSPQTGFAEPMMRRDPMGFGEAVLQRVLAGQQQFTVDLYHGHFLSDDRRHALLLAEPLGQGMDIRAMDEMLQITEELFDEARKDERFEGLRIATTGGPVYATSSAGIVKKDVRRAMGATGIGILLVFLLFFRNLRVMAMAFVPPAIGVAAGIALLGFSRGEVHGLGLGFGAAMLGITVDYTIHLFTRTLQLEAEVPRVEAIRRALAEVSPSLGMGCLTTLIGFGTLLIADTQVLRDMSTLALGGIGSAFLLCVVIAPLAYRHLGGKSRPTTGNRAAGLGLRLQAFGAHIDRHPWRFLTVWVVVSAGMLVASTGLNFDGDIRNLDYQPEHVVEEDRQFQKVFGAGASGAMLVVDGENLEQALQANDKLDALLAQAIADGRLTSASSPASLLPSRATQLARLQAIHGDDPELLYARVTEASTGFGFVDGYFQPFFDEFDAVVDGEIAPLEIGDLGGTAVGEMLERRLAVTDGLAQVLTLVETTGENSGVREFIDEDLEAGVFPHDLAAEIEEALPGTLLISFPDLAARLMTKVQGDLARLGGVCLAALALVLLAYYRRPLPVLFALLPAVASFVYLAGMLALLEIPLNVLNVCGVAITLGVSIDYGIFVVDRMGAAETGGRVSAMLGTTGTGVLVSAVTTIIGLGTMIMARNPAMQSMGMVVIAGIAGGLFTAVIGVPALMRIVQR